MGHWYNADGKPQYTIIGANGKERDTTLRDARKLKLVPSVTTIIGLQDKPALLLWKQNQILDACIEFGCYPETDNMDDWRKKVVRKAEQISKEAAEYGTLIHDSIETFIKGGRVSTKNGIGDIVVEVRCFLKKHFDCFEWVAEDSFAHPLGFGGKIDLYGIKDKGKPTEQRMVLDFKTKNKNKEEMDEIKAYDDHHLQTAAYVKGLEDTKDLGTKLDYSKWGRYNLFIGYDVDFSGELGFTGLKLTQSVDFEREWGMFEKLLEFWKLKNNYEI